jgi:hypothetical protein
LKQKTEEEIHTINSCNNMATFKETEKKVNSHSFGSEMKSKIKGNTNARSKLNKHIRRNQIQKDVNNLKLLL